jgi:hypothetical protein
MDPIAIIDPRLPEQAMDNLRGYGFLPVPIPLTEHVDESLSGHPDIQMFLHEKNLFVHPDIDISFLKTIDKHINIIQCRTKLSNIYPGDIPYNIACTGNFAFHKKNSTEKSIIDYLSQKEIEIINTNQGYAKCSTMIVDEQSIITSDKSIKKAAEFAGIDCLFISEGYIELPGYNYGFIGGASGRFDNTVFLTGSLEHHPDKDNICGFIGSKGVRLKILSDKKIFDSGSILFIE